MPEQPGGTGSLAKYHEKRDFNRTPEPAGDASAPGSAEPGARFVVQRHRARRTHYDFRLEVDGVLASWAMPKGPTLDPKVRALAVHVEDHPIEYRDFEGVIPKGEYGGGDVIVWDRGTWVPEGDPAEAISKGEIHFDLFGEKLLGRFVLVKTRMAGKQEQWLMLHKHDEHSVVGWSPDEHPRSVKSGRTNDEVAAAPDSLWDSRRPAAEAETPTGRATPLWESPTPEELEALDRLDQGGTWALQGRELTVTNLDKVLFPARPGGDPVTKRDLIRYYAVMAPLLLPYFFDRPVNMNRFPNGIDHEGFWHKQAPDYAPDWLHRAGSQFVLDSPAALAWMGNYAAVELHPWTSRADEPDRPTWALIDIDPGPATTAEEVLVLARLFRDGLEHLKVRAAAKVTGQRGIHIWIPVEAAYSFAETRQWVEKLSRAVGATVPELVSWNWTKSDRSGLARLDYTQNASNKTLIGPYCVRPAPGAPVSVPVTWDELDDPGLRSDAWTIRDVPARIAAVGDLWDSLRGSAQRLPAL